MSDTSQGPGWWQASDSKWYPPEQHPNYVPPPPPPTAAIAVAPYPVVTPQYPAGATPQTNGLAIASLVLSIVWLWGLGALLAIIFSIRARRQIRESNGTQGGDGLAVAGLVIGIIGLLGAVLVTSLVFAVSTAVVTARNDQIASCRADAKSVETALEAYRAQNKSTYPILIGPWNMATYLANYSALTNANANGGPWLRAAPSPFNYVIEYDSNGHVWVEGPRTYDSGFNSARALDSNPNACDVAVP